MENPPSQDQNVQFKVVPATYKPKKQQYKGDIKIDWCYVLWCVAGTALFMTFSPMFEHFAQNIPDIDTGSKLFENWYFRYTVNTTWLPLSQLVAFVGLAIYGWSFINLVNCQRKNPFTSGNAHYKDFKILLMMAPLLFLISGVVVMRSANDLSGYCSQSEANDATKDGKTIYLKMSPEEVNNLDTLSAVLETEDDMLLLFHTIQQRNYMKSLGAQDEPVCKTYTQDEIYAWNQHLWVMGFFLLGLQFTHTDIGPLQHFTLTWQCISQMGLLGWAVLLLMASVVGSVLYFDFEGFHTSHVVYRYGIWAAILIGFIVWNTKRLSPDRNLHIHHYFLAWMMLTFICYQNEVLTVCHGFAMGVFIEGGCRWGFDPIWTLPETDEDIDDSQITKPKEVSKHTTQERKRWVEIKSHQSQIRSENEKKISEAPVDAPQHPIFQQQVAQVPQTSYLQPAMVSVPIAPQAPNMQYVTFVPNVAPMMQQPMQLQQQVQPVMYNYKLEDNQLNYTNCYRAEPTIYQQPVQAAPRTAPIPKRQSNLPPELLGLLSHPEL